MGIILESFAQFMPGLYLLLIAGIVWDIVAGAWRGRF